MTLDNKPYYPNKCKWCGKPFLKKYSAEKYCSEECCTLALQDQKAEYQRKRRKQIKEGVLISNENKHIGTNFLSEHCHEDLVLLGDNLVPYQNILIMDYAPLMDFYLLQYLKM